MPKEIKEKNKNKGKYQVEWNDKDKIGWYRTLILCKDEKEAKTYAKTAEIQGCRRINIIPL